MDLVELLNDRREEVLNHASEALGRARLQHYVTSGSELSRQWLSDLLILVAEVLAQRNLTPICRYSEDVAEDRYLAGFGIEEVQTAFNVLEEAIWHEVVPRLPTETLAQEVGLVGTVLGAGKDALARKWVSLAASRHVATLNLAGLFAGTKS